MVAGQCLSIQLDYTVYFHIVCDCSIVSCVCSILSTDHSDNNSVVSPPVTSVDAVTVQLHSQCSGACSDVQETAEVQS